MAGPLTIDRIRKAIPQRCFESSLPTGLYYCVRDLSIISSLIYTALHIPQIPNIYLRTIAWAVYGYVQGLFFTGIWIIAHECGHGSFSKYKRVNEFIGWVLHSLVLVPFFSWQLSHQQHHAWHNHMDKDTAHVPWRKEELQKQTKQDKKHDHDHDGGHAQDAPIVCLAKLVFHQIVGWPMYLLFYASSSVRFTNEGGKRTLFNASHFDPTSIVFKRQNAKLIIYSDLGLLLAMTGLYYASQSLGWSTVALLYGVPYLWVNHWITAITMLHHSHPDAVHYEDDSWSYLQGALSTIDRDFGWVGRNIFHNIIEFHVIHHLFPRIPFYHAEEATAAIKPLLGNRFIEDKSNFWSSLYTCFRDLKFTESKPNPHGSGTIRVWGRAD